MNKTLTKKFLTILVAVLSIFAFAEEDKGTFYKLANSPNIKGLRGLALRIAVPNTAFHYTPATTKEGVLTDLAMSAYAISHDNTIIALAESMKKDDENCSIRVLFMDFARFKVINGIEFSTDAPIKKMFFFYDKLYFVTEGKTPKIQAIQLGQKLKLYNKSLEIPEGISSICQDKIFFYVKCLDKKLMQIDDALKINSTVEARYPGGVIFIRGTSNFLNNLTKENLEIFSKNDEGIYKSNYHDLKNSAAPAEVFIYPRTSRYFFFSTKDGELYKLTDSTICEKLDVSPFQDIIFHPRRHEFYLLANKKNIIEILRVHDLKVRREINHYRIRPVSYRLLKFMIPHNSGIFLISQRGEFMLVVERKRRFYKYKYLD